MFEDNQREVAMVASEGSLVPHAPPTVSEKLANEKKELELRLEAVNGLIRDLDNNPETKAIIDRLSQLGHRMY